MNSVVFQLLTVDFQHLVSPRVTWIVNECVHVEFRWQIAEASYLMAPSKGKRINTNIKYYQMSCVGTSTEYKPIDAIASHTLTVWWSWDQHAWSRMNEPAG